MAKQLQKSLQDYLSKIKKPSTPQINLSSRPLSSSTSWILRSCKHPKTPSFAAADDHGPHDDDDSATLSDVDRFLQENFKSLYEKEFDEHNDNYGNNNDGEKSDECCFDSPRFKDYTGDLCGFHKFFVEFGSSSSLTKEPDDVGSTSSNNKSTRTSACDETKEEGNGADDFITVLTYSPRPYDDFRRSMLEMIEARLHHNNGKVNWEFMEELLFCYLNLNHKKSYKYILRAFVDLIVILRENSNEIPARSAGKYGPEGDTRGGKRGEM